MTRILMSTNVFVDWVMHGTICQKRGKLITLQEPVPKTKNTSESIHVGATLNNHGVLCGHGSRVRDIEVLILKC